MTLQLFFVTAFWQKVPLQIIPNITRILLLDQEKTFNQIHLCHPHTCITCFGLLPRLINCITFLFFNTSICVIVNGFLSVPFAQSQGDSLSLLLFNIAIEPLLRTIYASASIPSFPFQEGSDENVFFFFFKKKKNNLGVLLVCFVLID